MIDVNLLSFFVLAVASVASAIGVIAFRNAVHSALSLILTLLFLALFYLQLGAMFISIVQILIYAGAIMVLFLITIMLLNAGAEERTKGSRVAILLGIPGVLIGGVLVAWTLLGRFSTTQSVAIGALWGDPKSIARLLFHDFLLPFEVTSVLILIAIMGAVVLASRPRAVTQPHRTSPALQEDRELVATGKDH